MITQFRLRAIGVAVCDRFHDCGMITNDLTGLAADREMKPADAVDMDALPPHQRPQIGHAGSGVQNFMESQIRFVEAFEITGFGVAALLRNRAPRSEEHT